MLGSTAPILPASSNEGITGTWSPAVVDNMTSGTYTFTPDVGQCGVPVTIPVTVLMPVTSTVYDTIPQGANYFGHTTTGTYTDTYTAANGCDSVRTLYLVVNPQNCFIPTINPSFETPLAPPGQTGFLMTQWFRVGKQQKLIVKLKFGRTAFSAYLHMTETSLLS